LQLNIYYFSTLRLCHALFLADPEQMLAIFDFALQLGVTIRIDALCASVRHCSLLMLPGLCCVDKQIDKQTD